ncbi:hypothetical protein [Chitinophaga sp. MM2321]|uniref:hypothetical protein n=1 Tax=Chitinophaga sp. MM2321 TaxID=3137178 RepID=UPI0032D5B15E
MVNTKGRIEVFFRDPKDDPDNVEYNKCHSTLYLLRRDIYTCFGINPTTGEKLTSEALFPAVTAIMTGIDLIAKFRYGDSDTSKCGKMGVKERFEAYCKDYVDSEKYEILFQLRNSLCHSFGLYAKWKKEEYKFVLARDGRVPKIISKSKSGHYWVNINLLHIEFEQSILQFHDYILSTVENHSNFNLMFSRYGTIGIGKQ